MLTILKPNHATTNAEITAFESARSVRLPVTYKNFLLMSNGGTPIDVVYPIDGLALNPFGDIQVFFGIKAAAPMPSLESVYDLYAGGVPHGIVPIADNGGGNYLCLDLRGSRERVVFWDKGHFWSTGTWREKDLYAVADSFDQFLTLLRPNPY